MTHSDEVKAYMESLGFVWSPPTPGFSGYWYNDRHNFFEEQAEFFYNAQKEAVLKILNRVGKEVIGENDIVEFGDPLKHPSTASQQAWGRDKLRVKQRQKLDSIIKELEG